MTNHQHQRQLQLDPRQTLALKGSVSQSNYQTAKQLDWNHSPILGIDQLQGVDYLADFVYGRFLSRPGMTLESHGRFFTLPDDFDARTPPKQLPSTLAKKAPQRAMTVPEQRLLD